MIQKLANQCLRTTQSDEGTQLFWAGAASALAASNHPAMVEVLSLAHKMTYTKNKELSNRCASSKES